MSVELTVVVKGIDGEFVKDAKVSVTPGEFTETTNDQGEASLVVDGASRYQVGVAVGDIEQTVPFYTTTAESARLEVNLAYFKQLQSKTESQQATEGQSAMVSHSWYQDSSTLIGASGAAALLLVVAIVIIRRRSKAISKLDMAHKTKALRSKT